MYLSTKRLIDKSKIKRLENQNWKMLIRLQNQKHILTFFHFNLLAKSKDVKQLKIE